MKLPKTLCYIVERVKLQTYSSCNFSFYRLIFYCDKTYVTYTMLIIFRCLLYKLLINLFYRLVWASLVAQW